MRGCSRIPVLPLAALPFGTSRTPAAGRRSRNELGLASCAAQGRGLLAFGASLASLLALFRSQYADQSAFTGRHRASYLAVSCTDHSAAGASGVCDTVDRASISPHPMRAFERRGSRLGRVTDCTSKPDLPSRHRRGSFRLYLPSYSSPLIPHLSSA